MKLAVTTLCALMLALPVAAQQPAANVVSARSMLNRDIAVLQVLDKVSARTTKMRVPVNSSAAFGLIVINVRSCQIAPPSEAPESAAFLEISEIDINNLPRSGQIPVGIQPSKMLYSGWMFASSPALSALEHPIYDVSIIGCETRGVSTAERAAGGEEGATAPAPMAPALTPPTANTTDNEPAPQD